MPDPKKPQNHEADSDFHSTQAFDMSTMPMGLDTFASENIDLEAYAREDEEKSKASARGQSPATPQAPPPKTDTTR